ncbi:MAG: proline dehydrogenase family protein [Anaerolineales bacterium]
MLRALLLYLSKAPWARRIVMGWRVARRATRRFISGETIEDAIKASLSLNQEGLYVTIDHLGENVTSVEETKQAAAHYLELLESLQRAGVQGSISVKLSQMGQSIEASLCHENIRGIVEKAKSMGTYVRLDIEDSPTIDRTLQTFHQLKSEGFDNVGPAIQSYLYRSQEDVAQILKAGGHIRLCKGAYKEPAEVAFQRMAEVNANFDKLTMMMIDSAMADGAQPANPDGKAPPVTAIASHDVKRVNFAKEYAAKVGFSKQALEFQMLLGIRPDLQRSLAAEGYPVRVYLPHGAEWYPYYMRRLAERPANLWFFISNFFRR